MSASGQMPGLWSARWPESLFLWPLHQPALGKEDKMIKGDGRWWRVQAQHLRLMRKSAERGDEDRDELERHLIAAESICLAIAKSKPTLLYPDYPS